MIAQPATDFSGMAKRANNLSVATPEEATREGSFQRTNDGLKMPFRLRIWSPPKVKPPITR